VGLSLPALVCFLIISLSSALSNSWRLSSLENTLSLDMVKSKRFEDRSVKYLKDLSIIYIYSISVTLYMSTVTKVCHEQLCVTLLKYPKLTLKMGFGIWPDPMAG